MTPIPGPNFGFDSGIFVDKLSLDGSHLLYSMTYGVTPNNSTACQVISDSFPAGLAADNSGHLWMTGSTSNPCIPSTPGVVEPTLPSGNSAGFLTKLDTNKSGAASIVYTTYVGTPATLFPADWLSIAPEMHTSPAMQPRITRTPMALARIRRHSGVPAFITKFNATASARIFSSMIHGVDGGVGGIAIDPSLNVYIAGNTSSTGFPDNYRRFPAHSERNQLLQRRAGAVSGWVCYQAE